MRFPNENLDDFKGLQNGPLNPPTKVALHRTGEIEVLKPLAHWEGPIRAGVNVDGVLHRLSWFHRSLAMGGAMAMITFLLGTGLYLAVYGPPHQPSDTDESAIQQAASDTPAAADLPATVGPFRSNKRAELPRPTSLKHNFVPVTAKRRSLRFHVFRADHRPQHVPIQPQMWVSQFVPTVTIIYVENGVVRTRVEPQNVTVRKPALNPN